MCYQAKQIKQLSSLKALPNLEDIKSRNEMWMAEYILKSEIQEQILIAEQNLIEYVQSKEVK